MCGSGELLSKLDLIILLSASSLGSGIYNHVLVCSVPPRRVNTNLILSTRDTLFPGPILPITVRSGDAVPSELLWRCARLKDDLNNYHLNSLILTVQSVSSWTGKSALWGAWEGSADDCFLKLSLPLFLKIMYITIANRQTQNNKKDEFHENCYCQSIDHGYSINHDRL